ncbi:MAG: hypothetical protein RXP98_01475 [Thermoplasmata archaeon]|jgi:di/tricarboxylate transporter
METKHIPLIMEFMDNNVFKDRKKYSNALIVKILLILLIYGISYRSAESFFRNHHDIKNVLVVRKIPNFRKLSRRTRMIGTKLTMKYYNHIRRTLP